MAYCYNCGAPLVENANFCGKCGAKQATPAAGPAVNPAPVFSQPAVAQPVQPVAPAPVAYNFSAIPVRYLCPNGHVIDGSEMQTACPKCGAPLPKGGYIQIYRMGNFSGMAVGMGIYLNDTPCGHLGNKQSIRLSVPFGMHKLHMTHTTTRFCNDPVFNITPENPYVFCKAHFAKAGFKINIDPATPDSMPTT